MWLLFFMGLGALAVLGGIAAGIVYFVRWEKKKREQGGSGPSDAQTAKLARDCSVGMSELVSSKSGKDALRSFQARWRQICASGVADGSVTDSVILGAAKDTYNDAFAKTLLDSFVTATVLSANTSMGVGSVYAYTVGDFIPRVSPASDPGEAEVQKICTDLGHAVRLRSGVAGMNVQDASADDIKSKYGKYVSQLLKMQMCPYWNQTA